MTLFGDMPSRGRPARAAGAGGLGWQSFAEKALLTGGKEMCTIPRARPPASMGDHAPDDGVSTMSRTSSEEDLKSMGVEERELQTGEQN
jgi:hypothetical protein